jgi:hypothetical protein
VPDVRCEQLDALLDDPRQVARGIDDSVPRAALQRAELAVAIAVQLLDVAKQLWMRPSTVEQRDRMTTCARGINDVWSDEACATEDQDLFGGVVLVNRFDHDVRCHRIDYRFTAIGRSRVDNGAVTRSSTTAPIRAFVTQSASAVCEMSPLAVTVGAPNFGTSM